MQFQIRNLTEVRKFMNGYYWYFGLRLGIAVLLPSVLLYKYGLLLTYFMIPLGVQQLGLTDVIGDLERRIKALLIGLVCIVSCSLLAGYSRDILWLQLPVLLIIAFTFSLAGVYGTRMQNIGLASIVITVFFMDKHFVAGQIFQNSMCIGVGGLIYIAFVIVSYKLRPYKLIQQMLGEHLAEISEYLKIKSEFYAKNADDNALLTKIIRIQPLMREQQESLREIILKTNISAEKSSLKSRSLLMMFIQAIDLYEMVLTSQVDYKRLRNSFSDSHIVKYFGKYLAMLGDELQNIGLSVQSGKAAVPSKDLAALYIKAANVFYDFRKKNMKADNMEEFIMLRQILYSLEDINERIIKLYAIAAVDKDVLTGFSGSTKEYELFIPKQDYNYKIFFNSFTLKSGMFRHALRLTVALLIGWILGNVLASYNVGHVYWLLMTIVIVVKPAYSQSRSRNIDRALGTLIGGIISFFIILKIHNPDIIFIFLAVCVFVSCTFSKINYRVYTTGLTVMVVLTYYYLMPSAMTSILVERLINSLLGVALGYIISLFVFPNWENKNVHVYLNEMIVKSKIYFQVSCDVLLGKEVKDVDIKLARKNAVVALANLSDTFQKMTSDPKKQQQNAGTLFRLVSVNNMLISYLVSLVQYAKNDRNKYPKENFRQSIYIINGNYETLTAIRKDKDAVKKLITSLPENEDLRSLLQTTKEKLKISDDTEKDKTISIRKTVTDYQTIHELFHLINGAVCEEGKAIANAPF